MVRCRVGASEMQRHDAMLESGDGDGAGMVVQEKHEEEGGQ